MRKLTDNLLTYLREGCAIVLDFTGEEILRTKYSHNSVPGTLNYFAANFKTLSVVMHEHFNRYLRVYLPPPTSSRSPEPEEISYTVVKDPPHVKFILNREARQRQNLPFDASQVNKLTAFRFFLPYFQLHYNALYDFIVEIDKLLQQSAALQFNFKPNAQERLYSMTVDNPGTFVTPAVQLFGGLPQVRPQPDVHKHLVFKDSEIGRRLALTLWDKVRALHNGEEVPNFVMADDLRIKSVEDMKRTLKALGPNPSYADFLNKLDLRDVRRLERIQRELIHGFKVVKRWLQIVLNEDLFHTVMGNKLSRSIRYVMNDIIHAREERTDAVLDSIEKFTAYVDLKDTHNSTRYDKFQDQLIATVLEICNDIPPGARVTAGASTARTSLSPGEIYNSQYRDYLSEVMNRKPEDICTPMYLPNGKQEERSSNRNSHHN